MCKKNHWSYLQHVLSDSVWRYLHVFLQLQYLCECGETNTLQKFLVEMGLFETEKN